MANIDLDGRIAFVTGAGSGIGRATTEALLANGCTVLANVRALRPEVQEQISTWRDAYPGRVSVHEGPIDDSALVEGAIRTIFDKFKRLDIVVNNAGVLRDAYIGMIDDDTIDYVLRSNLLSVIKVTQAASRLMKRRKSGTIINLSSIIGRRGNVGQLVYGASKAGVIGATLSSAKELAPHGIRVNAIAPGLIDTRMTADLPADARGALSAQIGMGRLGTAEDVADAILFLASDLSRYVTGQVIGVDGGLVL